MKKERFVQGKSGKVCLGILTVLFVFLLSNMVVFAQEDTPVNSTNSTQSASETGTNQGTQTSGDTATGTGQNDDTTQQGGNDPAGTGNSTASGTNEGTAATTTDTETMTTQGVGDPPSGLGDEGEPYAVPDGNAHIKEIGSDITYKNDATGNAIQKAIADAITYAQSIQPDPVTGKKQVTIVVADGVYQGGLDLSMSQEGTFANLIANLIGQGFANPLDGLQLNIVANDALDANGNPTANSKGGVQVDGDINVEGLDVLLAGLYLSLQGNVKAGDMDSFSYYGTQLDDNVVLALDNIRQALTVDGGGGDDTLDISITQAPNLELNIDPALITALQDILVLDPSQYTGVTADQILQLIDMLNAAITGQYNPNTELNALIKGGAGNDKINVHLKNSTALSLGLNNTGYGLKLDLGRTILDILGEEGSDEISVTGGLAGSFDKVLTNAILQYAISHDQVQPSAGSQIRINGGAGDDLITVDTTTAFSSFVGMEIAVEGGGGYDRLHLTGKLDKDAAEADRITGDANALFLKALAEMTFLGGTPLEFNLPFKRDLHFTLSGMEAFTDQLANKRTIDLVQEGGGNGIAAQSFTDYVLAVGSDGMVNFSSTMHLPAGLFLATLLVNGQKLTVQQLLASGFNVMLTGEEIEILGRVVGRNILLLAYSTDTPVLAADISLVTDDLDSENDMVIDFGLYDADSQAKITIGANAQLTAEEALYLSAISEQNKPFIPEPLADSFNLFTLKLGKAVIDILGQLQAGGTLWAKTAVSVVIDATNELLKVAIPLAVGAASTESKLSIGGNAVLNAAAGICLSAATDIKIISESTGGVLKFSLALAVVEANTHVDVGGDASITAGGDVGIKADSRVSTTAAATGKLPSQFADKASSGVFVAVSVIVQETSVNIRDNASLWVAGALGLASSSMQKSSNVAVAIPDEVKTTPSLFQTVTLIKKLMGAAGPLFTKAQGLLGGDKSPDKQIEQGTSQAKPEGQSSSTQLVGAFAVSYTENENRAEINTNGNIEAVDILLVRAFATTYTYARADGSLYKTPPVIPGAPIEEVPDNAIGVAITVVVFGHTNEAAVRKGNIKAGGLQVLADSPYVTALSISKAGHVPMKDTSKIGLGGAISVQVVSVNNHAAIGSGSSYSLTGGSVKAAADGRGWFVTVADASGKRATPTLPVPGLYIPLKPTQTGNPDSVGIGAGIAVGVTGIDTSAIIEDGVVFNMLNGATLDSLEATASFTAKEEVDASAGAAGGTAVVPVLALNVSGLNVEAKIGTSTQEDKVKGDVVVNASGTIERNLTANAAAVGTGVGIGAAFGIAIVNDSAEAALKRSVKGRNIYVDAKSISRIKETIKASAKGAKPQPTPGLGGDAPGGGKQGDIDDLTEGGDPGDGSGHIGDRFEDEAAEADKFADKNTKAGADMAGQVNSKNVNTNTVNNLVKDRQRAQTNEGNVQVAAAFALNIQKNVSFAYIGDGLVITAQPENGSGGEIRVRALTDTDAVISANASATNSIEGVGVGVAINIVTYENKAHIGDSRLKAASLLLEADIVEAGEKKTVEEILTELFSYIATQYDIEHLVEALQKFGGSNQSFDELIAAAIAKAEADAEEPIFSDDATKLAQAQQAVKDQVAKTLSDMVISGQVAEVAGTVIAAIANSLVQSFLEVLTSEEFILSLLFPSQGQANPFEFLLEKLALTGEVAAKRIRATIATALTIRFGSNNELDNVGNKISTQAVSGVGASNVGIAGAAAIAVVNGYTDASFAGRLSLLEEDIDITGDVVIRAESAQKIYTTASASADKKGMPDKNKSGSGETKQGGSSVGVGASAAVSVINVTVNAGLGNFRNLKASTLSIVALLRNDVDTVSVAGSDPIARRDAPEVVTPPAGAPPAPEANNTTTKDIAVDASAAVGMIANEVRAYVGTGAKVVLFGANTIKTGAKLANGSDELVNLFIMAGQQGETYTSASGFAVGEKTAIGAAVAVNLAASEVNAEFFGNGEIAGAAKVYAYTDNKDEAAALATVMGASIDRYLDYLRNLQRILSVGSHPPTGAMNAKIVNKLNALANPVTSELRPGGGGPKEAVTHVPLLSAVLAKLNVVAPGTPDTSGVNDATTTGGVEANGQDMDQSTKDGQSINIAAAVAANITRHNAKATISGSLTALTVTLLAENNSNFRTLGTGAAVTGFGDKNANNIAVGVAVTVNGNKAETEAGGAITARGTGGDANPNGDIRIESSLRQNMDAPYVGLLGAQALAGSVAASGGKVGVAGAVAIMVAEAQTKAVIGAGAIIRGGVINLLAADQSKFAVRAGGITVTGAKVGIGASFALIYARSETTAEVKDGASITAAIGFTAKAQRLEVNQDDYKFPFDTKDLFTVNATDGAKKGLVNLNIATESSSGAGGDSVEINLSIDDLLKLADMLNYLSMVNYYIESIAGSVVVGSETTLALAGSMSMAFLKNITKAIVGDDVVINVLNGGSATIEAISNGNARLIGGAVTFSNGKASVGVNVSAMQYNDEVTASVGSRTKINAPGGITVKAYAKSDIWAVTTAAAVTTGVGVGGNLNVILTGNKVTAEVKDGENGDKTVLNASGGAVNITADNDSDLVLISASIAVAIGSKPSVGGTLAVVITNNSTTAAVGNYIEATAKAITIKAYSKERLINILASLSASTGSAGVAGTLGVLVSLSNTAASVGNNSSLTATAGDIRLTAHADVWQLVIMAAVAASGGSAAVGGTVNVGVFNRTVAASVGKYTALTASENIVLEALGKDWTLLITMAGGFSSDVGVSGTIPVVVTQSTVEATLGEHSTMDAGGTSAVIADLATNLFDIAGNVSVGGNTAVGATVSTLVLSNTVTARVADFATIIGRANPAYNSIDTRRSKGKRGVVVSACADAFIGMVSVSGGVGGNAVIGVVNTLVASNKVKALVGDHVAINSSADRDENGFILDGAVAVAADGEQDVLVEASDETDLTNVAGGLAVGTSSVGIGATVIVMVYNKEVAASIGSGKVGVTNSGVTFAVRDVIVQAFTKDLIILVAVNCAVSSNVAVTVGGNVLVFESAVSARLGGKVVAGRNVTVNADSYANLWNVLAAVAIGGTAAVTPVAVVTYFEGSTIAVVTKGANIKAGGTVSILATSKEFVTSDALGASGSGTASVSGTVDIIITGLVTKAYTEDGTLAADGKTVLGGVVIDAQKVIIDAQDDYTLIGVAASIAVSGTAGVGVTALITVIHNTVAAAVGAYTSITARGTGGATVNAQSKRDIIQVVGTVAGGQAGVGVSLMVVVAGGKLTQDVADDLTKKDVPAPGEAHDENTAGTSRFDPAAFMQEIIGKANPSAKGSLEKRATTDEEKKTTSLTDMLEGDGVYQSETQVGDDNGNFDGTGGYYDDEFDDTVGEGENTTTPGEGAAFDQENEDLEDAAGIGSTKPTYKAKDTTSASIGKGAAVNSAGNISVTASDQIVADLITATLSIGAYAGVGIGIAVAVLFSNVLAYVEEGAKLSADGDITISAWAGSEAKDIDTKDTEEKAVKDLLEDKLNGEKDQDGNNKSELDPMTFLKRTLRMISITGSGGIAGVSGAIATLTFVSNVKAWLAGDVEKANNLSITAEADYPLVLAVTLAAAGGVAAVNISVALVVYLGDVEASVSGKANIGQVGKTTVQNVTVNTTTNSEAIAVATAFGGGAVAVNGAIAVVVSRTRADSFIGQGVKVHGADTVLVSGDGYSGARAFILGVAIGGTAVGLNAAVVVLAQTVLSYIGATPGDSDPIEGAKGSGGFIKARKVNVKNDITNKGQSAVISVAAGGMTVNGNVLLVFNRTKAYAAINQTDVTADESIDVDADMDSEASSFIASGSLGSTTIGVTVSYVQLRATNVALIDLSGGAKVVAPVINVFAGRENNPNNAKAEATALAGAIGSVNVGLNTAIADNATQNLAQIKGAGTLEATTGLTVSAYGKAVAYATLYGLAIGGANVAANFVIALLRSEQEATITGGSLTVGSLTVESYLNETEYDKDNKEIDEKKDTAIAKMFTGGGSVISVTASVAVAYGRSSSIAKVQPASLVVKNTVTGVIGNIKVGSYGNAGARAEVGNLSFDVISASLILCLAYAQGTFTAELNVPAGASVTANLITVETDYTTRSVAELTPSAGGVSVSYASIKVNLGVAVTSSTAKAAITGKGSITAGNIFVKATGVATAYAQVNTPILSVDIYSVAANVLVATLSATQEALIEDVVLQKAGTIDVISTLNNGDEQGANAQLGGNGATNVKISYINVEANTATALANATNRAKMSGVAIVQRSGKITVKAVGKSYANAQVLQKAGSVSVAGIGVNVLYAKANGTYEAIIDTTGVTMNASAVDVLVEYIALANAWAVQPDGGIAVDLSLLSIKTNIAEAIVGINANAAIIGNGTLDATGGIVNVKVTGTARATAEIPGVDFDASAIDVAVNVVTATLETKQNAYIQNTTVRAASLTINSLFNKSHTTANPLGAIATVGSNGGSKLSLVSGEVSTATATMKATVKAYTEGASLDITGALNLFTDVITYAKADISLVDNSIALLNVSVLKTKADAAGTFEAYIDTTGSVSGVKARTISVQVLYNAYAYASTGPAGGLAAGLASIHTNLAEAFTGLTAEASIKGNGSVTVTGTGSTDGVTVKMTGTAKAEAIIGGTDFSANAVSIAVNVAEATVDATQRAYVQDALIAARFLDVQSLFNKGHSTVNPQGAIATVGSNGGTKLSILSGEASLATATMKATVEAYTKDMRFNITGNISILVDAISYAKADVKIPDTTITLANATLLHTKAEAAGTFTAKFGSAGENNTAASISVLANYRAESFAGTGPAGGLGISGVNLSTNRATADTTTTATAGFEGGGSASVSGTLTIRAVGKAKAEAEGRTRKISVTAATIALNEAYSTLRTNQTAGMDYAGELYVGGKLTVESLFGIDTSGTIDRATSTATVGGTAGESNYSLLSVKTNSAVARSKVVNTAYIKGGGSISADAVLVNAKTYTSTSANSLAGYGYAIASFGNLDAQAYANDNTSAYVEYITLLARSGNIDILAQNDTVARAVTESPGSVELIGVTTTRAIVNIGENAEGWRQRAAAYIGNNATVTALKGNIKVYALNAGDAKADGKKKSIGIAEVSVSSVPTYAYYETLAYVGDGSTITAGGTITVKADDYTKAESVVIDSQVGFGISAQYMYGNNTQWVWNTVSVGASRLFAGGQVLIEAYSQAVMYALTDGRSGGFISGTVIRAENKLTRNTTVTIKGGAVIESDYGSVDIRTIAGLADSIRAYAYANGSGFVSLGKSTAQNTFASTSKTEVYRGATVKAPFGNVNIRSEASMGNLYAYAFAYQRGVGTEPNASAYNYSLFESIVHVGQQGSGEAKIVGSYVDIRSYFGYLRIKAESYSRGKGLGANVDARSENWLGGFVLPVGTLAGNSKAETKVSNVEIRGYKQVNIISQANPSGPSYHVDADAFGYIQAIGDTTANAWKYGDIEVNTYLGDNVVIYTADANVDAEATTIRNRAWAHTKRTGIASANDDSNNKTDMSRARSLTVNGVKFYLGEGAAGVLIDIDPNGVVRSVGLSNPSIVRVGADRVDIGRIENAKPGKLYIGYITGRPINYQVYGQDFLYEVVIINRSTRDVYLEGITLQNTNYVGPSINVWPGQGPTNGVQHSDLDKTYAKGKLYVRMETSTTANVHVSGLIANRWGDVDFIWTGKEGGNLTSVQQVQLLSGAGAVAPVWAHMLTIMGANKIGEGPNNRFAAYVFVRAGRNADATVTAAGDVYISLTPAVFEEVTALPSTLSNTPPAEKLYVEKIESKGKVDLLLADAQRIYGLKGSNSISIPLPGTLQYITGSLVGLTQDVTLTREALERYQTGYDPVQDVYIYRLPNGTMLYLDAAGNLLRITEKVNGVDVDTVFGDFAFYSESGDRFVQLGEGVRLNLTKGLLSIDKGYEFDALLSAIDASWITGNLGKGIGQFIFVYDDASGVEREVTLTVWRTEGSTTYYYLTGAAPSGSPFFDDANKDMIYYLISITGNTMEAYSLEFLDEGSSEEEQDFYTNYVYDKDGKRVIVNLATSGPCYLLTGPPEIYKATQYLFGNFGGSGRVILYNSVSDLYWVWNGSSFVSVSVSKTGDLYYVSANASSADPSTQAFITYMKGLYWSLKAMAEYNDYEDLAPGEDRTVNGVCYPASETTYYPRRWSGNYLAARWYEAVFLKMYATSLYIAPAQNDFGDDLGYYQIGFYDEYEANNPNIRLTYSNVSFSGAIQNIPIKLTTLPNSTEVAYRITNQMYVSTQGNGVVVMVEGSFRGRYDGTNYISDYLTINNVAAISSLVLHKNQQVMLERLTSEVAIDVQGRYYVQTNKNAASEDQEVWVLAGNAPAPTFTTGTVTLPDGTIINVTIETVEYLHNGKVWLKVEYIYNNTQNYQFYRFYIPSVGQGEGAFIMADSDGKASFPGGDGQSQMKGSIVGSEYLIGNLSGSDVSITMTEAKGSLVDGRTGDALNAPNVTAQNDITFISASSGSIGQEAKPLEIVSVNDTGLLWFFDLLGNPYLLTDAWLSVPQHNITIATDTEVVGKVLWLKTKVGTISFGRLTARNQGASKATVTLDSAKGIAGEKLTAKGSTLVFTARDGDIAVGEIDAEGSELTFDATGSITGSKWAAKAGSKLTFNAKKEHITVATLDADASTLIFTAGKNITTTTLTAKASTLTFSAGGSITATKLAAQSSTLTFTAGGNILSEDMSSYNSTVNFTATGNITVLVLDAQGGKIIFTTTDTGSGNIHYDIIESIGTELILRANGGGIYPLYKTSYLWADANSSIRLRAKTDIGTPGVVMIVDIPATLVLWVERVRNYYIDAVELVGGAFQRKRPAEDIRSGRDEDGNTQTGDYLGDTSIQIILFPLDAQTPEELAKWITDNLTRDIWAQLLTSDALAWMVEEGLIDLAALTALLVDDTNFTQQDLADLLADDTDPDRYTKLGAMLAAVLAVPVPDETDPSYDPDNLPVFITDEAAAEWLKAAIGGNKVQNLADTLVSLLTQEQLLELVQKAWEQSDYAGNAEPPANDPPTRAFHMTIEFSDGAGYVNNVGDIFITQLDGDLTAGLIYSDRGHIALTAVKGSILGDAKSNLHVDGWNITLSAGKDIGTAAQPLITEQRTNRPVLVGNITNPPTDANGNYIPAVIQVQVVDENGDPVLNDDGTFKMQWVVVFEIAYMWVRADFPLEATRLTATAGGSIYVTENSGDMGLGVVQAGKDVGLITDANIYDRREAGETRPNVTAGGNAWLLAPNGTIGLIDEFIVTDVDGQITALSDGDIHIDDIGNLILQADSANGQIYALAKGDMTLWNTADADLIVGYTLAGGDVTIIGQRSVLPGDKLDKDVWVQGVSISLTALDGTVGTAARPMLVDTDAAKGGTLSAFATEEIYIVEFFGDVIVGIIKGGADVTLLSPGNITDASKADLARLAAEAAKRASEFQNNVDAVRTLAVVLEEHVTNGRFAYDNGYAAVLKAITAAQAAYDAAVLAHSKADGELQGLQDDLLQLQNDPMATPEQLQALQDKITIKQQQVTDLWQKVQDKERLLQQAQGDLTALDNQAAAILQQAANLQRLADSMQQQADVLWQQAADALTAAQNSMSITAEGDLVLRAGGSVGEAGNALGIHVNGILDAKVGNPVIDSLYFESDKKLVFVPIAAKEVHITTLGDIEAVPGARGNWITGEVAELNAIGGDVGTRARPFLTNVGELSARGDNVVLRNARDLVINSIIADYLNLTVNGSITAGGMPGTANIIADTAIISATGNFGQSGDPVRMDVNELTLTARSIYVTSLAEELHINRMTATRHIEIRAWGKVWGSRIAAASLDIIAMGDIGRRTAFLTYTVPGSVQLVSILGWVYGRNQYRPPQPGPGPAPIEEEQRRRRRGTGTADTDEEIPTPRPEDRRGVKIPEKEKTPVNPPKPVEDEKGFPRWAIILGLVLLALLWIFFLLLWYRRRKEEEDELEAQLAARDANKPSLE